MVDRGFFELFADFRGYEDFFLLQECVSKNYDEVRLWIDTEPFERDPLPKDTEEYMRWIDSCLDFVEKRNERIGELAKRMDI